MPTYEELTRYIAVTADQLKDQYEGAIEPESPQWFILEFVRAIMYQAEKELKKLRDYRGWLSYTRGKSHNLSDDPQRRATDSCQNIS